MTDTRNRELPPQEALAGNVIAGRARLRIPQAVLAQRAGLSRTTIGAIERAEGDPTLDAIERIADALGVKVMELFDGDMGPESATDDELARMAAEGREDAVDADAFTAALDEAQGRPPRYSRAGRPRLAR